MSKSVQPSTKWLREVLNRWDNLSAIDLHQLCNWFSAVLRARTRLDDDSVDRLLSDVLAKLSDVRVRCRALEVPMPVAYVRRIAVNALYTYLRDLQRLRKCASLDDDQLATIEAPIVQTDDNSAKEKLRAIWPSLTPAEHELLHKHYWENQSIAQIAKQLGDSYGVTHMRYFRLHRRMRKLLGKIGLAA